MTLPAKVALAWFALGAICVAGFLINQPDALASLTRLAALVVFGDAS